MENRWTLPELTHLNGDYFGGPPHISPDGKRIYWRTNKPFPTDWPGKRPKPGSREAVRYWAAQKTEQGWSSGQPLLLPLPFETNLLGLSTTLGETIYTSISFRIVCIRPQKDSGMVLEKLPPYLNGHSPAVAPDESYLIYVSGTPRKMSVTFRNTDGTWTLPIVFGENINKKNMNGYPSITPDGRFLFYTVNHKLYWVSTDIIQSMKNSENR